MDDAAQNRFVTGDRLDLCGVQIVGGRARQEDDFGVVEAPFGNAEACALALADGMGGHAGGAEAARLSIRAALNHMSAERASAHAVLLGALSAANASVRAMSSARPDWRGMGCTLVLAIIQRAELRWLSVGDSHLFLYRQGALAKLNEDHSMRPLLEEMVAAQRMTRQEMKAHPDRNALRSAVSGGDIDLVDCVDQGFDLYDGDILILASDGLDVLGRQGAQSVLRRTPDGTSEQLARALIEEVRTMNHPRQDNTSVIVYRVTGVGRELEVTRPHTEESVDEKSSVWLTRGSRDAAFGGGTPRVDSQYD